MLPHVRGRDHAAGISPPGVKALAARDTMPACLLFSRLIVELWGSRPPFDGSRPGVLARLSGLGLEASVAAGLEAPQPIFDRDGSFEKFRTP